MFDVDNLQALCQLCHAKKTGEERRDGVANWEAGDAKEQKLVPQW